MDSKRFLIIGGTEKSGTTSVYQYLAAHPAVSASIRKETDYFRSALPHTLDAYLALFGGETVAAPTYMEASPGYLAQSKIAAPAIRKLIPQAKLLFILREPIARLLSGFEFHKSRFHIPEQMLFDEYIDLCMRFERDEISVKESGLKLWHLQVPEAGRYGAHLSDFFEHFPAEQIRVTSFEQLQEDPLGYVEGVCAWAGLDATSFQDFEFSRANVTFRPRSRLVQRVGLAANDVLEPLFNRYPSIKRNLLGVYKRLNGTRILRPEMSDQTRRLLESYYRDDLALLSDLVNDDGAMTKRWIQGYQEQ